VFRVLMRGALQEEDVLKGDDTLDVLIGAIEQADRSTATKRNEEKRRSLAEEVRNALVEGRSHPALAALNNVLESGDGKENAARRRLRAVLTAAQPDRQAVDFALAHLARSKENPFPDTRAPLRQRLKQLIVPGPGGEDVVITPLVSLPLMDELVSLANFLREKGYSNGWKRQGRLIAWQPGPENPQNAGVSGVKRFVAIRHQFSKPMQASLPISLALKEPGPREALQELHKAIFARRIYAEENALGENPSRTRSDLDERLERASLALAERVDEVFAGVDESRLTRDDYLESVQNALRKGAGKAGKPKWNKKFLLRKQEIEWIQLAFDTVIGEAA
jgi:hypothetical protein